MFLKRLYGEIISKKLINGGDIAAVAVSGGVDSMCLLFALKKLEKDLNFKVAAVNAEHGIRGQASVFDSGFVRGFCENAGIEFFGFSFDIPKIAAERGIGIEECAREERYGAFKRLFDGGKCTKIALAHHADDQAETIFMRILRGTGVSGLCGMKAQSDGIFGRQGGAMRENEGRGEIFIRPFLNFSRAEIEAFAREEGIPYVEDESNRDAAYTRNFIRNEVFPLIKGRFPGLAGALTRLGESAAEVFSYLEKKVDESGLIFENFGGIEAEKNGDKSGNNGGIEARKSGIIRDKKEAGNNVRVIPNEKNNATVSAKKIAKIPESLFFEPPLLKIAVDRAFAHLSVFRDIEKRHIDELYKLLRGRNGGEADMPFGVTAVKEYGYIVFYRKDGAEIPQISLADALKKGGFYFGDLEIRLKKVENGGALEIEKFRAKGETARREIVEEIKGGVLKREMKNETPDCGIAETVKEGGILNVNAYGKTADLYRGKSPECGSIESLENDILNKTDNGKTLYLDLAKIPKNAVIRTVKEGDVFQKFGGGTKKLRDYYTDLKIQKRLRERLPVLAAGSDILAVLGVEICGGVKLTAETREILIVNLCRLNV
ncbi:MAG: tRNA lysidine(34) synthetase TilS [Clostridiales bacterium]|jgi:tRNA(Ile)-lysidine synthetase-like protein|nr:tRNA lysidine(34) synthetase TilS [Clostridiales bacterium]